MFKYIFLLFTVLYSYSQNLEFHYGLMFNINPTLSKEVNDGFETKVFYQKMEDAAKLVTFQLIISDTLSTFKTIETLIIEEDPMIKALIKSFSGYEYFKNKKSNTSFKLANFYDKKYLISFQPSNNWNVLSEEKQIQGYTCFKAVTKTKEEEEIVAWFCPAFQFNDGPLQYGGLPGLIFELQTSKLTYFLKKINPKSDEKQPNFPKISSITEVEFEEFVKSTINKQKN
ncbi:MAG: GLPGLI family protein [Flavobacteriales bacterium]|nr:GLPGLI family protein [Flavobacteriales bacterium]